MNLTKQYILKPGDHQFAPGEAAIHNNNNLTDAEAAWYLKKYPHIAVLFARLPDRDAGKASLKKQNRFAKKSNSAAAGEEAI